MAAMKKFCCCCISLRTGGVIIGFLTLIAGLIMVTMSSIGLYGTLQKNDQVMEQSQREQDLTYDEAQAIVWGIRLWLGFYIAMSMIFVMCALLLIYGSLSVSDWGSVILPPTNLILILIEPSVLPCPIPCNRCNQLCLLGIVFPVSGLQGCQRKRRTGLVCDWMGSGSYYRWDQNICL